MEIWNFWSDPEAPANILVYENTTNFVWYKTRPLLLYNRTTVRLKTYTDRKVAGVDQIPVRALINVTNTFDYYPPFHTKFSIMTG